MKGSIIKLYLPLNNKLVQEYLPVYLQAVFIILAWQLLPNCRTYIPVEVRSKHPTYRECIINPYTTHSLPSRYGIESLHTPRKLYLFRYLLYHSNLAFS